MMAIDPKSFEFLGVIVCGALSLCAALGTLLALFGRGNKALELSFGVILTLLLGYVAIYFYNVAPRLAGI
jgi:hypothetical protein